MAVTDIAQILTASALEFSVEETKLLELGSSFVNLVNLITLRFLDYSGMDPFVPSVSDFGQWASL